MSDLSTTGPVTWTQPSLLAMTGQRTLLQTPARQHWMRVVHVPVWTMRLHGLGTRPRSSVREGAKARAQTSSTASCPLEAQASPPRPQPTSSPSRQTTPLERPPASPTSERSPCRVPRSTSTASHTTAARSMASTCQTVARTPPSSKSTPRRQQQPRLAQVLRRAFEAQHSSMGTSGRSTRAARSCCRLTRQPGRSSTRSACLTRPRTRPWWT